MFDAMGELTFGGSEEERNVKKGLMVFFGKGVGGVENGMGGREM